MADRTEPPSPGLSLGTAPQDPGRTRDLRGRRHHPWVRRLLLLAMTALLIVALTGRFGQTERVLGSPPHPHAEIELRVPTALRGGLMWRASITVTARRRIVDPELILASGYVAGMQLNTIAPAASEEGSRGQSLVLTYPTLETGEKLTVHLQLQVNPTTSGRQDLSVSLDGKGIRPVPIRLPAHLTVYR